MECVGSSENFWHTLSSIMDLNNRPGATCKMRERPCASLPYAEIDRGANGLEKERGLEDFCSVSPNEAKTHDQQRGASVIKRTEPVEDAEEMHPLLRGQCEALFERNANIPSLIAEFLNEEWGSGLLDWKTVHGWFLERGSQAPTWSKTHTLILEYQKFLNEQQIKTESPLRGVLIKREREAIDTRFPHPLRMECEVLFKHGARSSLFISQFFDIYKRGRVAQLTRREVQKWYEEQRNPPFCTTYRDKRQLISNYCDFLDKRWETPNSFAKKCIEKEKDRVMRHRRNLESTTSTAMLLRSSTRSFTPSRRRESLFRDETTIQPVPTKKEGIKGRKRKYRQVLLEGG